MRALVTGGAGFIGSHLVDRFLKEGYEVRILDDLDPRVHPSGLPKYVPREAEFVKGSVTDRRCWERALQNVDVVSHQAAYQDYMLDFSRFMTVNSVSTALLYEVLVERRWHTHKVIIASSQAVYGEGQYLCPDHGPFLPFNRKAEQLRRREWEVTCSQCGRVATSQKLDERRTNPCNQYAVSKYSGEQIGLGLGRIHQIPTVALRYSITQGPRQSLFNLYSGILRIFHHRARTGQPLIVYEDGLQTRDFVHVEDVIEANLVALRDGRADYEAFNVGSGVATTVLDYTRTLLERMHSSAPIQIPGQFRLGDNRHSVSSIEKLRALGWEPRHAIAKIIDDFLEWIEEIGGLPSNILDAYEDMLTNGVVLSAGAK